MSDDARKRLMDKVQKLLAKAESSPFSEEAQTFRVKAEELMTIHAIEAFELQERDPSKRTEPIISDMFEVVGPNSTIRQELMDLLATVASHCHCRLVYYGANGPKTYSVSAKMVGYPEDIEYAKMLYVSLRMTLAKDISPQWDPAKTIGQNVRTMKEAGLRWEEIARRCDPDWDGNMTSKWVNIYRKQCKDDDVVPVKANPANYVRNFCIGFHREISMRLTDMRRQAEATVDNSMALVMYKNKDADVAGKMRQEFKNLSAVSRRDVGKSDLRAQGAGSAAGKRADLSGGRNQTTTANHGKALPR